MNEPSIFKGDESTFPKSVLHFGGLENRQVHNLYGLYNAAATSQAWANRQQRPFILTRSFFTGSQKYSWTWTGDNTASWEHLAVSVSMVLTSGIAGMPFTGADVGGFLKSPDGALLVRWFQVGAWVYPFFREHCHHKAARREPFMFEGEELEGMRRAVQDRYTFLPLWYAAARRANLTGLPVVAPLWVEFPTADVHEIENQVIVGGSIMVVPVLEDEPEAIEVVKPPGRWFRYPSGAELKGEGDSFTVGLTDTLVFLRGGTIVPTFESVGGSAQETLSHPIVLYISPDKNGKAEGDVYFDDGVSYEYASGTYLAKQFVYANGHLRSSGATGTVPENLRDTVITKVVVFGKDGKTIDLGKKLSDDFDLPI
jgi:alpha 1,3-glucosidase